MVRCSLFAMLVACHAPRAQPAAAPVVVQPAPHPQHTPSRGDPAPAQPAFAEVLREPCHFDPRHTQHLDETIQTGECSPKPDRPVVVVHRPGY